LRFSSNEKIDLNGSIYACDYFTLICVDATQTYCVSCSNRFEQESHSERLEPRPPCCLRVEFLLKTDSGYPKDTGVKFVCLWVCHTANPLEKLRTHTSGQTCHLPPSDSPGQIQISFFLGFPGPVSTAGLKFDKKEMICRVERAFGLFQWRQVCRLFFKKQAQGKMVEDEENKGWCAGIGQSLHKVRMSVRKIRVSCRVFFWIYTLLYSCMCVFKEWEKVIDGSNYDCSQHGPASERYTINVCPFQTIYYVLHATRRRRGTTQPSRSKKLSCNVSVSVSVQKLSNCRSSLIIVLGLWSKFQQSDAVY